MPGWVLGPQGVQSPEHRHMVGVVYHEEQGRAWAGSLALRFLLHSTESALHGSGLHGTIVLLSSCHSTRENSYLLVDARDPRPMRRSTYHGKVNSARPKQACQDIATHIFSGTQDTTPDSRDCSGVVEPPRSCRSRRPWLLFR